MTALTLISERDHVVMSHWCQTRPSADNSARRPFADDFERCPIRRTPQRWRIADTCRALWGRRQCTGNAV